MTGIVFWIFMMLADLLVPGIMIGFGSYSVHHAPKEIGGTFGYRTTMSMLNRETWEFAHHHNGKIWRALGWTLLILTVIALLPVCGRDVDWVGRYAEIVGAVQVAVLLLSIIPTEVALRRNFDRDGRRKE